MGVRGWILEWPEDKKIKTKQLNLQIWGLIQPRKGFWNIHTYPPPIKTSLKEETKEELQELSMYGPLPRCLQFKQKYSSTRSPTISHASSEVQHIMQIDAVICVFCPPILNCPEIMSHSKNTGGKPRRWLSKSEWVLFEHLLFLTTSNVVCS